MTMSTYELFKMGPVNDATFRQATDDDEAEVILRDMARHRLDDGNYLLVDVDNGQARVVSRVIVASRKEWSVERVKHAEFPMVDPRNSEPD